MAENNKIKPYPHWNSEQIIYTEDSPKTEEVWEYLVFIRRNEDTLTIDQKAAFEVVIEYTQNILNETDTYVKRYEEHLRALFCKENLTNRVDESHKEPDRC